MATLETQKDFAARLGVHKSTISRAAKAGRLVMQGEKVLVEESLRRWHETVGGRTDVSQRHAQNRGADIPKPQPDEKNATARESVGSAKTGVEDMVGGRTRFKTLALQYENQTIKLELALRRGMRYQISDVRREAYAIGATLRASVERLIDQVAPRLAVLASAEERERLLRAEVAALRRMVRAEFPRALRRMRKGQTE